MGAGPKDPRLEELLKPQPSPLLPLQQAWLLSLATPPSAGGAMDAARVYVPLTGGELKALERETGAEIWTQAVDTAWPPVAQENAVYVATPDALVALEAATGDIRWLTPLDAPLTAPLAWSRGRLLAVTEPGEVRAFSALDGSPAWRRPLGASSRHPAVPGLPLDNGIEPLYLATTDGRTLAMNLADGALLWERNLPGTLSVPAVARDRVFVGSTDNFLYALDAESGKFEWKWRAGGDVVGAAADDKDIVYFASLDNILRAVNRGNGNQRWKEAITTRPSIPPVAFDGIVVLTGVTPQMTAFDTQNGQALGTYAAPADLEGPPLIDRVPKPFQVSAVVVTRDGRVVGLRSEKMLLPEPAATPLLEVPGRQLPRERLVPPPVSTTEPR